MDNLRNNRTGRLAGAAALARMAFWFLAAFMLCALAAASLAARPDDVPSASAGLGPCTADFIVSDAAGKPIYNAKVHVKFKYGFMSKSDTELDVGTNSDGKARFEGLPTKLKKPPMEFTIQSGDANKSVTNDPMANCHPTFSVALGK